MPYQTHDDLPDSDEAHLPVAPDTYREAFNHACAAHVGDVRQEEAAHRIAWARGQALLRKGRRELDFV
jgi:cation transport regulator